MITSMQQKNKALKDIERYEKRLKSKAKAGVPEVVVALSQSQLRDSIADLKADIDDYEAACSADIRQLQFSDFLQLCRLPIIIRLSTKMTIPQFAQLTDISESQLKRYEATEYEAAPPVVLSRILAAFNLTLNSTVRQSA